MLGEGKQQWSSMGYRAQKRKRRGSSWVAEVAAAWETGYTQECGSNESVHGRQQEPGFSLPENGVTNTEREKRGAEGRERQGVTTNGKKSGFLS